MKLKNKEKTYVWHQNRDLIFYLALILEELIPAENKFARHLLRHIMSTYEQELEFLVEELKKLRNSL